MSQNMEDILKNLFRPPKKTRVNDKIYLNLAVWALSLSDTLKMDMTVLLHNMIFSLHTTPQRNLK
jgi:hypothetical protein